jgi:transposase-like protein
MRWVLRYAPEFEKRGQGYEKPVALSYRVDETYLALVQNPECGGGPSGRLVVER